MDYVSWIKARLPKDIPESIIAKNLMPDGYVFGLSYYRNGEKGPDELAYHAKSEADLLEWLFVMITKLIAFDMEKLIRDQEMPRWRYVWISIAVGKRAYIENHPYVYNTVYDGRKYIFEYHLGLIKPVVTKETYQRKADEYEKNLNLHFPFPHWRFDESLEAFVEVSDSKDQRFNDI